MMAVSRTLLMHRSCVVADEMWRCCGRCLSHVRLQYVGVRHSSSHVSCTCDSASARAEWQRRADLIRLSRIPHELEPRAAVLVPVCVSQGSSGLLYTVRPITLTSHAGEVAFPGGLRDPGDRDLQETSIRECREELGLQVNRDQICCRLPDVPSSSSGKMVASFVANIGELNFAKLTLEPAEVDHVFFLPFDFLCDARNSGHTQFRAAGPVKNDYCLPMFINGPHRVWGLTAILTRVVLNIMMPGKLDVLPRLVKRLV